jgi:hypothetical protein
MLTGMDDFILEQTIALVQFAYDGRDLHKVGSRSSDKEELKGILHLLILMFYQFE